MHMRKTAVGKGLARFETALSGRIDGWLAPMGAWWNELQMSLYSRLSEDPEDAIMAQPPVTLDSSRLPERKAVIRLEGLTKVFGPELKTSLVMLDRGASKNEILESTGGVVGLRCVDLEVYEGEIFVIMGLSGCGKSTLERCLNRLVEPTRGRVIVNGTDITALDEARLRAFRRRHMGMVFQNFGLLPHRSVKDNVALGLEVQGVAREERLERSMSALALVGLKGYENVRPSSLSGGMKQRVGLARALATNPEILLMDEAFSALDPLIRKNMQEELLDLQTKVRKTIIFVTHDLDEALRLGDRIAIMRDGTIVQVGTPEEILSRPADNYVAKFLDGVDRSKLMTCENVMKAPELVIPLKTGLRTALKMLEDIGQTTGFVVDRDKGFMGMVRADDLLKAISKEGTVSNVVSSVRSVAPSTMVEELITILVETDHPIPVLSETNRLVGVIYPASVMDLIRTGGVEA